MEEQHRKMAEESIALRSMTGSVAKAFDAPPGRSRQKAGSARAKIRLQLIEKRVDMLQETMQAVMDQRGPWRDAATRAADPDVALDAERAA